MKLSQTEEMNWVLACESIPCTGMAQIDSRYHIKDGIGSCQVLANEHHFGSASSNKKRLQKCSPVVIIVIVVVIVLIELRTNSYY